MKLGDRVGEGQPHAAALHGQRRGGVDGPRVARGSQGLGARAQRKQRHSEPHQPDSRAPTRNLGVFQHHERLQNASF